MNIISPKILNPLEESELNELNLILNNANPVVFDEIHSQLKDYIKLSYPQKKFTESEYNEEIYRIIGLSTLRNYGNWAYYPWTNRLVHILPENEFKAVRTVRNRFKITSEEEEILSKKKIGIIGLSVGQSVALALAMERTGGEIRIADFDQLELSNMNRIRTGVHNLNLPKTIIVAREIAEIDPYLKVTCFNEGITEENMSSFIGEGENKLDLIIDECDSINIKILCREQAQEHKIPVLMDTSDRGMLDVERFDLEPNRPLFHGLLSDEDVRLAKKELTPSQKFNLVSKILDFESISERMKLSMGEIGKTITTWPQLATSVLLGGAVTAIVARKILLSGTSASGRYYVDIDKMMENVQNQGV